MTSRACRRGARPSFSPLFVREVVVGSAPRAYGLPPCQFQSPLRRGGCRRCSRPTMRSNRPSVFQSPLRRGGCRRSAGMEARRRDVLAVSVPSSSGRLSSVMASDGVVRIFSVSVPSSSGRLSSALPMPVSVAVLCVSVPSSSGRLSSVMLGYGPEVLAVEFQSPLRRGGCRRAAHHASLCCGHAVSVPSSSGRLSSGGIRQATRAFCYRFSPLFVGEVVVGRAIESRRLQVLAFQSPLRRGGCRRATALTRSPCPASVSVPSSSGRLSSAPERLLSWRWQRSVSVPSSSGRLSSDEAACVSWHFLQVSVPSSSGRLSSAGPPWAFARAHQVL